MTGPTLAGPAVLGEEGQPSGPGVCGADSICFSSTAGDGGQTSRQPLKAAKYVYVRHSGTIPSLEPLYPRPFRVLDYGPKVFRNAISGKEESVSSRDR